MLSPSPFQSAGPCQGPVTAWGGVQASGPRWREAPEPWLEVPWSGGSGEPEGHTLGRGRGRAGPGPGRAALVSSLAPSPRGRCRRQTGTVAGCAGPAGPPGRPGAPQGGGRGGPHHWAWEVPGVGCPLVAHPDMAPCTGPRKTPQSGQLLWLRGWQLGVPKAAQQGWPEQSSPRRQDEGEPGPLERLGRRVSWVPAAASRVPSPVQPLAGVATSITAAITRGPWDSEQLPRVWVPLVPGRASGPLTGTDTPACHSPAGPPREAPGPGRRLQAGLRDGPGAPDRRRLPSGGPWAPGGGNQRRGNWICGRWLRRGWRL